MLTAFRDNAEKVAAAIAECRRLGIDGPPAGRPRVAASAFTVEGEAIRFGLLAVKNVGEGAIESIIAAREEGGDVPVARPTSAPGSTCGSRTARSSSRWPRSAR